MTLINVRIDESDKKEFAELCNKLGLSISTAFNLFIKQSIRDQRIPVELALRTPNKNTVTAIEDANKGIGLSDEYSSVEELADKLETSIANGK